MSISKGKGNPPFRDIDGISKTMAVEAEIGRDQYWRAMGKKGI